MSDQELYGYRRFRLVERADRISVLYDRLYGGNWVLTETKAVSPTGRIYSTVDSTNPDVIALVASQRKEDARPKVDTEEFIRQTEEFIRQAEATLNGNSLNILTRMARRHGIKGYSRMTKAMLVKALARSAADDYARQEIGG